MNKPVAIVQPEREKPGNTAIPWANAIKTDCFKFSLSDLFALFFDKYSLKNSTDGNKVYIDAAKKLYQNELKTIRVPRYETPHSSL